MTRYVVAVTPGDTGSEVVAVADLLRSGAGATLDVVTVIPAPWEFRSKAGVDAEYVAFLQQRADAALDRARSVLGDAAGYHVLHRHRSVPVALLDHAEQVHADALLLGSSTGAHRRFTLGSATSVLLHRSPIPVVTAPAGYEVSPGTGLRQVTVGVSGSSGDAAAVQFAAALAREHGVPLRVASVQTFDADMAIPVVGFDAERAVDVEWAAVLKQLHEEILEGLPDDVTASSVLGRGLSWTEALEDLDPVEGEILVIGSSTEGRLRHVFLGTHSTKIVRNSGVPVVVVPAQHKD